MSRKKLSKGGGVAGIYAESWNYLRESKKYFLFSVFVFLFVVIFGFVFPVFFVEMIQKFIEELVAKTAGMGFLELFLFIFQNNLLAAFFSLFFGILFGIFPFITLLINGYVIGFVARKAIDAAGICVLWRLLPHGIFELPALIISLSLGLKLGMFILAKKKRKYLAFNLINSAKVFLFVVVPLLLVAGIIEAGLMFLVG